MLTISLILLSAISDDSEMREHIVNEINKYESNRKIIQLAIVHGLSEKDAEEIVYDMGTLFYRAPAMEKVSYWNEQGFAVHAFCIDILDNVKLPYRTSLLEGIKISRLGAINWLIYCKNSEAKTWIMTHLEELFKKSLLTSEEETYLRHLLPVVARMGDDEIIDRLFDIQNGKGWKNNTDLTFELEPESSYPKEEAYRQLRIAATVALTFSGHPKVLHAIATGERFSEEFKPYASFHNAVLATLGFAHTLDLPYIELTKEQEAQRKAIYEEYGVKYRPHKAKKRPKNAPVYD